VSFNDVYPLLGSHDCYNRRLNVTVTQPQTALLYTVPQCHCVLHISPAVRKLHQLSILDVSVFSHCHPAVRSSQLFTFKLCDAAVLLTVNISVSKHKPPCSGTHRIYDIPQILFPLRTLLHPPLCPGSSPRHIRC
jgi:hypothetical protein